MVPWRPKEKPTEEKTRSRKARMDRIVSTTTIHLNIYMVRRSIWRKSALALCTAATTTAAAIIVRTSITVRMATIARIIVSTATTVRTATVRIFPTPTACRRLSVNGRSRDLGRAPTRSSNKASDVGSWHIATIRGSAATRSLSERSGHSASRAHG